MKAFKAKCGRWVAMALFGFLVFGAAKDGIAAVKRDDVAVRRALTDELNRSIKELAIAKESKPYFMSYGVTDEREFELSSVAGAIVVDRKDASRDFDVTVRVGSPKLDNSYSGMVGFGQRGRTSAYPFEDDYDAIRRELWLMSDGAYKQALEFFNKKKSALLARAKKAEESILDFAPEPAQTVERPVPSIDLETQRVVLTEWISKLSAQLAEERTVISSSVRANLVLRRERTLTSEGAYRDESHAYVSVVLDAMAQADDGMYVSEEVPFTANSIEGLPSLERLTAHVVGMLERLKLKRQAELPKAGTALVLFESEAANALFASLLSDSLSGAPPPRFSEGDRDDSLASKLGTDVASPLLSVYDDPSVATGPGRSALWGHYFADEEVVLGKKTSLIENGVLKTLLMSRAPRKEIPQSNGHRRNSGVSIGNLFVTGKKPMTRAKLIEFANQLSRKNAKTPTLIYAVRRFAPENLFDMPVIPGIGGAPQLNEFSGDGGVLIADAYRIDGKKEVPVRGLRLDSVTLRSLKDVVAVGDQPTVSNYLCSGTDYCSTIAPSVLLERVDTRPQSGEMPRLPAYARPNEP